MTTTPDPLHSSEPRPPTRRDRVRQATITEILDVARVQLAEQGATGLSLRSVARDLGMTPSAIYRYFASRDDLITALMSAGFTSLADHVEAAEAKVSRKNYKARWLAGTRAYREWSIAHPAEHALLFGSLIPGFNKSHEVVHEEFYRGVGVLLRVMGDALAVGALDLSRTQQEMTPTLRRQVTSWKADHELELPETALLAGLLAWTQLIGVINAEMFCQLPPSMCGSDALFTQQMTNVFARIGFAA